MVVEAIVVVDFVLRKWLDVICSIICQSYRSSTVTSVYLSTLKHGAHDLPISKVLDI